MYFSDQGQALEERVGGQAKAHYVWSPVYVNALVLRDRDATGGGSLNERLWVQQDANWNVTALVNGSSSVVERYVYLPFGQVTYLSPAWVVLNSSACAWLFLHQGGRFDPNTGLYRFGRRDYSPGQGRWVEVDPIGFRGGDINLYRADANNPVRYTDPSGEIIPLLVVGGVALVGVALVGLAYAAYRYEHAQTAYLSRPASEWTPEVRTEFQDYVKTTEWIASGSTVVGALGIWLVATPVLAASMAGWWGIGLFGKFVVGGFFVTGLGSAGYEGYSIYRDWGQMSGPQQFERVGLLAAPFVAGGLYSGPGYFRAGLARWNAWRAGGATSYSVSGPAHTPVTGSEWYEYFSVKYGAENVTWSRVPPYAGGKTQGVLRTSVGDIDLLSGYDEPSASMGNGTVPGMNYVLRAHVEAHAASAMRQLGLNEGTLYLTQTPCVWRNGGGCNAMLPRMLGEGRQLRVVVPQ